MLTFLHRLFCSHKEAIVKTNGPRLYTECLHCGLESRGVLTGISGLGVH